MIKSHDIPEAGVSRPVVVLFCGHLLSAAVWIHAAGRLGIPAPGMPALFFAWPLVVSGVLLLDLRLPRSYRDGPGPASHGEKAGRAWRVAMRAVALLPHAILAVTVALLVFGLLVHFRDRGLAAADDESLRLALVLGASAAFVLFFLNRWAGATAEGLKSTALRSLIGLSWLGLAAHALFSLALVLKIHAGIDWFGTMQLAFGCLLAGLLCEALLLATIEFYRPAAQRGRIAPGTSAVLGWVMARSNPARQVAEAVEAAYGIKLKDIWAFRFLKRLLLPLLLFGALVIWLATSLTIISAENQGVRVRMGQFMAEPLGPGLHAGLPWPFDEVIILPTKRVNEIHLGYDVDLGGPVLWNEPHYEGERNMLADNGETLLTVSVLLHYRISDPLDYVTHAGGHREALRLIAYRELVHTLAARESFEVMIGKRAKIARQMNESIQAEADRIGLGIKVLFIGLRDIHPPVGVAPAYQDVVSAEEERHALVNRGHIYREASLPLAKLMATRWRLQAEEYAKARLASAKGEAKAFEALADAFSEAPELLRHERWLRVLEESLAGRTKLITGRTGGSEKGPLFIDFRFSGEGMPMPADHIIMEEEE